MKSIFHILIVLTIAVLPSCTNEIYNNIARINYGTSFGECVGFCKREVTIISVNATFNCYSWYPTTQTVTNTLILDSTKLDSISRLNTSSFFELPEVIGCPDCADGGAEWLEIELTTGETHKVTFEYYKEPDFIKPQN
jgi:hypothetical protein